MDISKYLDVKNYKNRLFGKRYRISYAQCGEDILIDCALGVLGISAPTYLDIGANDPISKNNTFLFYSRGAKGVCVEPNPLLFNKLQKRRRRDTCLNIGIGTNALDHADYYVMTSQALNTFKKEEADKYVSEGNYGKQRIEKVLDISLLPINTVIEKYLPTGVDILSIDTEGYDLDILRSIDLQRCRPKVICVETSRYQGKGVMGKEDRILEYLIDKDYVLYADTYVNSILVDKKLRPSS